MAPPLPPTLPMDLRRDAERLFDFTLWCLGKDVSCPEGNLLLRRGLHRQRPPEGQQGNSVYTAMLPGGGRLNLWGFGVLCDEGEEAVFLARDGFTLGLVELPAVTWPVFQAAGLGTPREPRTLEAQRVARSAVASTAEWLALYEQWVLAAVGPQWRASCLAERRKAPPVRPGELAAAWWRLSLRVRALDFVGNDLDAPAVGA